MVLDSSALIAILMNEPERRTFVTVIEAAAPCVMSVANFLETAIVIEARFGMEGARDLDLFLSKAHIELIPVDVDQGNLARRAYREFGKGRHPAGLNYGDCFAYALAKVEGAPLLYKGQDFIHTDLATPP
ncbi:MAG: type II toxin-antitoxin system VapC family toxin [Gammaproteobacteria bacterium]|nr:type II toxin-antitoxin system VapC family toxin [Gammaproteobacteria bacterium]